jgi:hypothetical protein
MSRMCLAYRSSNRTFINYSSLDTCSDCPSPLTHIVLAIIVDISHFHALHDLKLPHLGANGLCYYSQMPVVMIGTWPELHAKESVDWRAWLEPMVRIFQSERDATA